VACGRRVACVASGLRSHARPSLSALLVGSAIYGRKEINPLSRIARPSRGDQSGRRVACFLVTVLTNLAVLLAPRTELDAVVGWPAKPIGCAVLLAPRIEFDAVLGWPAVELGSTGQAEWFVPWSMSMRWKSDLRRYRTTQYHSPLARGLIR
jgi:hypothetical protein